MNTPAKTQPGGIPKGMQTGRGTATAKALLHWSLGAAIAVTPLAIAPAGFAQTVKPETADQTVWGQPSADPFSSDTGAAGLMDLMQQLNRGPSQSWSEFRASQQENLNTAAGAFRARQLQLLNGKPAAAPSDPQNTLKPAIPASPSELELRSAAPDPLYRALW